MDNIYLQLDDSGNPVTWSAKQEHGTDIEYILLNLYEEMETRAARLQNENDKLESQRDQLLAALEEARAVVHAADLAFDSIDPDGKLDYRLFMDYLDYKTAAAWLKGQGEG